MKKKLYWLLVVVLAGVFLFSLIRIGQYFYESYQSKKQMEYLQSLYNQATNPTFTLPDFIDTPGPSIPIPTTTAPSSSTPVPGTSVPDGSVLPTVPTVPTVPSPTPPASTPPADTEPTKPTISNSLQDLYTLNNDVVGWISIADTPINYPVLQRKSEKDYYLYRDFFGKDSKHGSIYVREACDVFGPSDNVTIYGHNMADGSMFTGLLYFTNKGFFNNHKYVQFNTLTGKHTYRVICVFATSGTWGEGFPFHTYENFRDEAEYESFINGVRALAMYDSGVPTSYGDKFLCLSTCYRSLALPNGRLVLVAKRIS